MYDSNYQRFVDSMAIGQERWRDRIGYDLQALQRMQAEVQASAEALLIDHLRDVGDWRDVEALAALDTRSARAAVEEARHHRKAEVQRFALRVLIQARIPRSSPSSRGW